MTETGAKKEQMPHSIRMENRHSLTADGISSIISCDADAVTLETREGTLAIGGEGLTVSELSVQTGEVKIHGKIGYLQYTERREPQGRFWKRLVR